MKVYNVVQREQFYKRRLVLLLTDLCFLCLSSHLPSFLQESGARSNEKRRRDEGGKSDFAPSNISLECSVPDMCIHKSRING